MGAKIAFIGAGSFGFSKSLFVDIVSYPELRDAHFALMDIDAKYLDYTKRFVERTIKEHNLPATYSVTLDQKEAIKDADFVVIMIRTHGIDAIKAEYEIPKKHGIDQCIGDTIGPGGVFRFLRTAPYIESICRDTIELAKPDAWILNYTNPMAMLTWMSYDLDPRVKIVGLCHSVQGTTGQISTMLGIPYKDVKYWVAGINHQAWILEYKLKDGTDLMPRIREELPKSEWYDKSKGELSERVRIEMLKHLGYFVTESSGHNSEYNPWFRKRDDLIEEYTGPKWAGGSGYILELYGVERREEYEKKLEEMLNKPERIEFKRSHEYCSTIINSIWTDEPSTINGNVKNTGIITNLPYGCCVEVPCLVNGHGVTPCFVGDLPPQCAALNRMNINVQELAVKAYKEKCKDYVYYALYYDPLTAAKLSLAEIKAMVDEMFEYETARGWLPELK